MEFAEKYLFPLRDAEYAAFTAKLIPNIDPSSVIGVRSPDLRRLAQKLKTSPEREAFLASLPHRYLEENTLHAFLLSQEKDVSKLTDALRRFLPYVDNWATCDSLNPKVFQKYPLQCRDFAYEAMQDPHSYTVRFGIALLMRYFLDDRFSMEYPSAVAEIRSEEYYVNMMIAWYFATALAKQYEQILPFITRRRLSPWCHNKTISKAIESYRLTSEQKEELKRYRIKTT